MKLRQTYSHLSVKVAGFSPRSLIESDCDPIRWDHKLTLAKKRISCQSFGLEGVKTRSTASSTFDSDGLFSSIFFLQASSSVEHSLKLLEFLTS